jgi:hypothetical protein
MQNDCAFIAVRDMPMDDAEAGMIFQHPPARKRLDFQPVHAEITTSPRFGKQAAQPIPAKPLNGNGAPDRSRTRTPVRTTDFESLEATFCLVLHSLFMQDIQ